MAILLFRLNGVPEDEAADVRALLDEHRIDYYETESGRWGISLAAIWLKDESQLRRARELIDDYQQRRFVSAREEYERRRLAGEVETLLGRALREPLRFLLYLAAILLVLYLSLMPFLGLAAG
jgi:hypothetical protein